MFERENGIVGICCDANGVSIINWGYVEASKFYENFYGKNLSFLFFFFFIIWKFDLFQKR